MKENFGTERERMWSPANGKLYRDWKEKNIGKIVRDRLGCLFLPFVAVYLISPLTSNKMLTPTPCFWGWLCRALAPWGTRCCAGPWLWGSQLPTRAWGSKTTGHLVHPCITPRACHGGVCFLHRFMQMWQLQNGSWWHRCHKKDRWHPGLAWLISLLQPSLALAQLLYSSFSEAAVPFWESLLHAHKG